jgi:hypothetical protein
LVLVLLGIALSSTWAVSGRDLNDGSSETLNAFCLWERSKSTCGFAEPKTELRSPAIAPTSGFGDWCIPSSVCGSCLRAEALRLLKYTIATAAAARISAPPIAAMIIIDIEAAAWLTEFCARPAPGASE